MKLYEEIAKVAHELYEKSGRIEGRDTENWLEAERIVRARHSEGSKLASGKNPKPAAKTTAKTEAKKTGEKKAPAKKTKKT